MERLLTIIESPYAGDVERNVIYARRCMRDSINRGETPFSSTLLYAQEGVLNDDIQQERLTGMALGFQYFQYAEKVVFYVDYGISKGMFEGLDKARQIGVATVNRKIGENP